METLSFEQMENVHGGGDWLTDACKVIGAGSLIYVIGVEACWWNPIGWVSAAFIAVDAGCLMYTW